jgi:hypothetical protein
MDYTNTAQTGNSYNHMWDVATTREFEGGFLFDKTTVPVGTLTLPKGALLKVDQVERKATLIKAPVLQAALTALATEVRILKGSHLLATDVIGTAAQAVTVGVIDTSDADYDSFAISADDLGALAVGAILQTYDSAGAAGKVAINPDGLNYADVELDAQPTCTVIYEAKGVQTARLPQGVTAAIKAALKFIQFIG